jgi:hypothetical protein
MKNIKLQTFLFLLMRDSVPIGEIFKLLNEVEVANEGGCSPMFVNKPMEKIAEEMVERLMG